MMNQEMNEAYQPPESTSPASADLRNRKRQLASIGIQISVLAMVSATVLTGLAMIGIVPVHWDSLLVPGIALFLCVPLSVIGGILSLLALVSRPSWWAGLGILLSCLATVVSTAAAWLLAMVGLANHPV